jgi:hypothetical protein
VKWRPDVRAVRTRDKKLIHEGESGNAEVFDLREDPNEARGTGDAPGADQGDLSGLLEKHVADLADGPTFRTEAAQLDRSTREKLRALGYLDEPLSPEPAEPVGTSPERPDPNAKEERS